MPALTRPAGVVRSVALSRLRLPRRSFTFALISSGCAGTLAAWPTACVIGSWIAGILVRILDSDIAREGGSRRSMVHRHPVKYRAKNLAGARLLEEISRIDRSSYRGTNNSNPSPSSGQSVSRGIFPSYVEKPGVCRGVRGGAGGAVGRDRRDAGHMPPTGGNISVGPNSSTAAWMGAMA
jgi:hypothetical protein